jgi:tetratricopeptide (TPR) repeat protein
MLNKSVNIAFLGKNHGHWPWSFTECLIPVASIVFACAQCFGVKANDFDAGKALLIQGDATGATAYIKRAYAIDSLSPEALLAYASILVDGQAARKVYQKVWENKAVSSSAQSEAAMSLGDAAYARGRYTEAYQWYDSARIANPGRPFDWCRVRAAIAMGKDETAIAILDSVPEDVRSSQQHLYYLGSVRLRQKRYDQAFDCFSIAIEASDAGYGVAAVSGAIEALDSMGDTDRINDYKAILTKLCDFSLENSSDVRNSLRHESPVTGITEKQPAKTPYFTLQTGAFSSLENATRHYNDMKKSFSDVAISSIQSSGKMLHRVRVGRFGSENDAIAFGQEKLKLLGVSFRVIKE